MAIPAATRQQARHAPTMADLCRRFLDEHAARRNKPGTAYNYRRMIERFVLPTLGHRRVADITRADIEHLHHRLADTPYQANRVVGLVSKMMNLAERWGLRRTAPIRSGTSTRTARLAGSVSCQRTRRRGWVRR